MHNDFLLARAGSRRFLLSCLIICGRQGDAQTFFAHATHAFAA
jgi:hypothetical protein